MSKETKSILISGASSGIGRHCALSIAGAGFKVFAGVRNEEAGEQLEKEASGWLEKIHLDISDVLSVESAVQLLKSENLYAIINNAGIAVLGPLEFIPISEIRRQFEVNLFGHIAVTQAFLPLLRQTTGSRIINMSSISGFLAFPFYGSYASSKFALEAFNEALRRELDPWKIKVISIQPGNIKTPIWEKSFQSAHSIATEFPPEAGFYYPNSLTQSKGSTDSLIPPSAVSRAVLKALKSKQPKAHYRVGLRALKYAIYSRLLPTWVVDRLI
ncbi:SDR family oxidoreductase [Thermodesulfobacteriota bacterium]